MRFLVSLALMASGVCAIVADRQRWYPACAGRHRFDTEECVLLQDHRYDIVFPADPWVPIGQAAQLMAVSYALLALAAFFVFRAVLATAWTLLPGAVVAASFVVVAAQGYLSGEAGRVVAVSGTTPASNVVMFVWPLLLGGVALWAVSLSSRHDARWWTVALATALLALASPLVLYFTASVAVLYGSHDTSPWTEAVGGLLTVAAGAAFLLAPAPLPPRLARVRLAQPADR